MAVVMVIMGAFLQLMSVYVLSTEARGVGAKSESWVCVQNPPPDGIDASFVVFA